MKNLFTGEEIQTYSPLEFTRKLIGKEKTQTKISDVNPTNQLEKLRGDISSLRAENELYRMAFAEIAKPETNTIAKIRAIAERLSDELNCV